jgi:type I restriction enzyme M protein
LLSEKDEDKIIDTINGSLIEEDFSVVVSNETIQKKGYSFSAGLYFDVKFEYVEYNPDLFSETILKHQSNLVELNIRSLKLSSLINNEIEKVIHGN